MSSKYAAALIETARAIGAPGKGILAADESTGTIGQRFDSIKVENTEENRRKYRQLLFTTEGIEQYVSGVILFEETLYQTLDNGKTVSEQLKSKNILIGIKVCLYHRMITKKE
jgi:fructose-bisphosphate aldolase class I